LGIRDHLSQKQSETGKAKESLHRFG
jgi:hypothetical protein